MTSQFKCPKWFTNSCIQNTVPCQASCLWCKITSESIQISKIPAPPDILESKMGHSISNQQEIVRSPLGFWWNLVCLWYLWCPSPVQIFSSLHHIRSCWSMTANILNISWKIAPSWVTKATVAHHCFNIFKTSFSVIKDC